MTDRKDLEKDRRERRKEDRDERDKERSKDRDKYREKDKDRKDKRREQEKDRETEKDRGKEKSSREREKGREKHKDHREKERDSEKTRENGRDKERDRPSKKAREEDYYRSKNDKSKSDYEDSRDRDVTKQMKVSYDDKDERNAEDASGRASAPASELENRILRMKEERLKKKSEGVSEVLSWVSKSRKLEEEKNAEKEKALQLSKIFEEQDNIVLGESEDEEDGQHNKHDLSGIKVLHGLDKVMDGGAVVLTLKDQNILADGDINDDIDMLENIEIGEQKRRDEAYKAAKKKTGIYDDKFGDDPSSEKKMLPQYDDPAAEEGVTLDARGRFTGEAEKKLEELRRRLQGTSTNQFEDLSSSAKISSDYYTHEEMLQFKKPKKKKSLRKKEKLDLDALEAEAVSSGLGVADRGSRNDGRRQAIKEEQERIDAEMRNNAYQSAYAKADEATKALRLEQTLPVKMEEDENLIADDDEDLYKSLGRARKLAIKKQEEAASGPKAIALLAAAATCRSQTADDQNPTNGESQENKVVFTEIEEFAWGLQLVEEAHKPDNEDVFMDEDEAPVTSEQEIKDEAGGWTEVKDTEADENPDTEDKEEIVPDDTIHEVAVGKGLSGALKLLKDRGTLKESIEWGGRNMDKKKSKLVGIVDDKADKVDKADKADNDNRFKDLRIERMDEFGRIMTPKEAFRLISHKFHGKGPGKMKQEKRMKQYHEELKLKQMKNSDTPSESVERMREAQSRLKTPYLVLSGHVKPGQTSDPRSGFATVEKDLPGGLTPMLGNSKVEHFLGIKRKAEPGNSSMPKRPKS
ncbi:hypothetical protein Ddye_021921 [Dipteronia dyeriana]|uniref:Uncharacterized protein n=1 Tax=Dipteronia dyeriana TaxID=168575 RepID=A0AAD9WXB6_9ROSI|nr:hypothetical protein Ddye_021921 [Dipteronia dyeriana]